ncbi:hypothetical protein [Limibacterium fermenti]|uniref:hypothetical protein n=1 Tax=Limibacterium fermenti TaxID=3229863 RepID=UPI000E95650C|nr:hypothetical protein [Porphyromonadaceae bacterium]
MRIDFYKLIEQLLPTFLRKDRILAFLRVLVAKPLQQLFVKFHLWRMKSRYEASVSPQVISLIHAIERTFDCVAELTELDGKPYDFLISIDRSTDLNAIREFIDKHKLAGKSYLFKLGDAAFSVTWLSHTDEHLIEEYSAEWTEYIDSRGIELNLSLTWNNMAYGQFPELTRGWAINIEASEPVTSDLEFTVSLKVFNSFTTITIPIEETLVLASGENWLIKNINEKYYNNNSLVIRIQDVTFSPEVDEHHFYDLKY